MENAYGKTMHGLQKVFVPEQNYLLILFLYIYFEVLSYVTRDLYPEYKQCSNKKTIQYFFKCLDFSFYFESWTHTHRSSIC